MGWVKFRRLKADSALSFESLEWAKPYTPLIRQIPVKGEIVFVTSAPTAPTSDGAANEVKMPGFYYMGPIAHSEGMNHNSFPSLTSGDFPDAPPTKAVQYEETSNSLPEEVPHKQPINKYGIAFTPALNIYPLQPLEGDTIITGRWGNSIRFSTSQPNPEGYPELDPTIGYLNNPWSDNENNVGEDPIIIIRNGQNDESRDINRKSPDGLDPIFESLYDDKSSIWLTDGQKINSLGEILNESEEDGPNVQTTKQLKANGLGNVYDDLGKATPQVVIASDRLIFASKDDEILLLGKNGIALSADNNIVIESNDTITISAPVIELAGEVKYGTGDQGGGSAINGEKLVELIQDLCDEVMGLSVITATGPGTAEPSTAIEKIKNLLPDALSSGDDQA